MIDYLVPNFFLERDGYNGGMHTKFERELCTVGSVYRAHVVSSLSTMRSDFLLIEPPNRLWYKLASKEQGRIERTTTSRALC